MAGRKLERAPISAAMHMKFWETLWSWEWQISAISDSGAPTDTAALPAHESPAEK